MYDLTCKVARRWLQEPDSLSALHVRFLNRHVMECPDCARYRHHQVEMDGKITGTLAGLAAGASVREEVKSRLLVLQQPNAQKQSPWARLGFGRAGRQRVFLQSAGALGAVAVVALLVALFAPQFGGRDTSIPTANAGWHAVRPRIGYPLTVDPTRSDHLLAGALGGVYQSWDAGATWTQLRAFPHHFTIRDLAIDAAHPSHYLVATLNSVLLSTDAGASWHVTAQGVPGAENIFLMEDPYHANVFYLGPSVLWHSVDGGQTWQRDGRGLVFSPDGIQSLTVLRNGDLYTGIWGRGVALSHDAGRTWSVRASGLNPGVMSVAARPDGRLWAATSNGVYRSTNGGQTWKRSGPPGHLFTTGVFDGGTYLLAGGNGGLYRSTDGGKHWQLANSGLPMDPYIFGFIADPFHRNRVYASLDSDGPYRSDDGGKHWFSVSAGLPLLGSDGSPNYVLFRRDGALWKTDRYGTDPGILTVDTNVRIAAFAGDGGAIAYVAGTPDTWNVKAICAGGCNARTLLTGSGALPRQIFWSPTGDMLAVAIPSTLFITSISAHGTSWAIGSTEEVLGWARDGHSLLTWDSQSGQILRRIWRTGAVVGRIAFRHTNRPLRSPDGKTVATIDGGQLQVGPWGGTVHPVAPAARGCTLASWSDDSTHLLVTCGPTVQERTVTGRLAATGTLPHGRTTFPHPSWAPGSDTDVLFFRGHKLWRWTPGHGIHLVVPNAGSVRGTS